MSKKHPRKNIFLIDYRIDGHRLMYLRYFVENLLNLGCKVVVFCPKPEQLLSNIIHDDINNLDIVSFTYDESKLRRRDSIELFKIWFSITKMILFYSLKKRVYPNLCFFMWLDSWLLRAPKGIRSSLTFWLIRFGFPSRWSGILFQPSHYVKYDPAYTLLKSRKCKSLFILDEYWLSELTEKLKKEVIWMPDFTNTATYPESNDIVKEISLKAKGRLIIGLYGALGKWKGIIQLVEAAKRFARNENNKLFFVFAGRLVEHSFSKQELIELKSDLSSLENCLSYFHTIEPEEVYNKLFVVSDIIFVAYLNFLHSSNTLTKSAYFRKPVLAINDTCIGKRVKQYNIGYNIANCDAGEIYKILFSDLETIPSKNFNKYYSDHSLEQFNLILCNSLPKLLS